MRDIARAVRFYGDVFGLAKTFENGEPVRFVILERDDAEIHLALVADHAAAEQNVMHMIEPLRDAPWGMRTFVVADPDGNRIDVGEPL